jgi:hypothetical protein
VKGEEPSASLVDTFGDEVGGEEVAAVERIFVLNRIVNLREGH